MSTTNILDLNNRIDELEKNSGGGGSADSAKRSDIATEFNTTTSYTAGCFVYHEGKLYQFNTDHAAGAWDPTYVVEANVTDQIVSNKSAIDGLTASDVAYDNTDSGLTATNVQGALDELADSYPASKVMMSDGVTSVEDRVNAHIVDGTFVDISSYIYDSGVYNDYTAPSDGYVVFRYSANADGGLLVNTSANTHITMATTKELTQSIFMKKGMQFCFGSTPDIGRFYPLA